MRSFLALTSVISTSSFFLFEKLLAFPGKADLSVVSAHILYMHESLEPTSRKRKRKKKKMSFHSSIFIFRGWMLIRERRKQRGVRNGIKSGGKKGRESEGERKKRGMKEGDRDGQGGLWLVPRCVRRSARKKCSVMRVLPLSEPEREEGT